MERPIRQKKIFDQKENDHKHLNKKSNLIASLNYKNGNVDIYNTKTIVPNIIPYKNRQHIDILNTVVFQPNTFPYCRTYGLQLEKLYKNSNEDYGKDFLNGHQITSLLRARMLDWMVQVTESYKFQAKTYFVGVEIMDKYFSLQTQPIPVEKLHIIGVVSMLIASKMQQVFPFRLKTVYQKIVHKKISIKQLIDMQSKIFMRMGFNTIVNTFYDQITLKIYKNYCRSDSRFQDQQKILLIQSLCSYLGKFLCYNYQIITQFKRKIQSQAIISLTLQILKLNCFESNVDNLKEIQICKVLLINTIKNYKKQFKGLNNIYKFANEDILKIIDQYFL